MLTAFRGDFLISIPLFYQDRFIIFISSFAYCYCLIFFKTISLLLCVLRDFSVLFPEIEIGTNRIESATCR